MGHLLAPFIAFDRLVQRGVDTSAFFLMRRGIPKSRICYGVMSIAIMSITGMTAELLREGRGLRAGGVALVTFFLLIDMHIDLKDARKAEEAGHMYSNADLDHRSPVLKIMWWAILSYNVFYARVEGITFDSVMNIGWGVSFLLLCYLAKTPNIPPAQKDTVLEPAENAA